MEFLYFAGGAIIVMVSVLFGAAIAKSGQDKKENKDG